MTHYQGLEVDFRPARRGQSIYPRAGILLSMLLLFFGLAAPVWGDETVNAEIFRLINAGQFDQARALSQAQNPSPSEAAFIEGRIHKVAGRLDVAIDAFRRSLSLDPNNLAARRELAHTLLLDRQFDVAEFHFESLLASDPSVGMHAGYRHFLQVIRQNKPLGASATFALIPSSNINRGTTNTVFDTTSGTFEIDPDSKAESGVGLQAGVSGYARYAPSEQSSLILSASLLGTSYKAERHNWATASVGLTYGHVFDRGRWSVGPYASFGWREDDADMNMVGLRAGIDYQVAPQITLEARANHEQRTYPNQSYNDGAFDSVSFGLAYQFDPTLVLRGTVSAEQSRPNALHLQYDGYSVGASLSKSWDGGLSTSISLDFGERDYVGDYPLTTEPRDDSFASVSVSLQNAQFNFNGLMPKLTCSYTANRSNVAFHDYDTRECQATLSTEF